MMAKGLKMMKRRELRGSRPLARLAPRPPSSPPHPHPPPPPLDQYLHRPYHLHHRHSSLWSHHRCGMPQFPIRQTDTFSPSHPLASRRSTGHRRRLPTRKRVIRHVERRKKVAPINARPASLPLTLLNGTSALRPTSRSQGSICLLRHPRKLHTLDYATQPLIQGFTRWIS